MLDLFMATEAFAQEAGGLAGGLGGLMQMAPFILIFVVFYFLLIRPQQKKAKAHREMLGNIKKGDAIITNGGIHGTVTGVKDNVLVVEIAPQVKVKIGRGYIAGLAGSEQASQPADKK